MGSFIAIKERGHEIELKENGDLIIKGNCIYCGDRYSVPIGIDQVNDWIINEIPIKNALSSLTRDQLDF